MKKIKSLLIIGLICLLVFSFVGQCLCVSANNTDSVSLIDLVRMKKYLAGMPVEAGVVDYNKDNKVDSRDLVYLINLIMNVQNNSNNNDKEEPKVDNDGYYNEVVKP